MVNADIMSIWGPLMDELDGIDSQIHAITVSRVEAIRNRLNPAVLHASTGRLDELYAQRESTLRQMKAVGLDEECVFSRRKERSYGEVGEGIPGEIRAFQTAAGGLRALQ